MQFAPIISAWSIQRLETSSKILEDNTMPVML